MADGWLRIEELFAWVALDPADNTEGILAFHAGDTWMPMVGADRERIESMRPIAKQSAAAAGVTPRLLKFSVREELE